MRCRACNVILESGDDPELCGECMASIHAETDAPIPRFDHDLYDDLADELYDDERDIEETE